jgi:Haem-binding uptake, Tiki superfamily, ChaN
MSTYPQCSTLRVAARRYSRVLLSVHSVLIPHVYCIALSVYMHMRTMCTLCSYDFNNYSKIFRYARLHGIRLVGLNAPVALVSLVSKQGLAALPRELSALLPEMDLSNVKHKARFHEAIAEVSTAVCSSVHYTILHIVLLELYM